MASTLVKVLIHIVFSTKKRVPFIDPALSADLYPYMAGIVRHKRATLLALGGMPDHVHALVRLKADLSLSDLVRALKAVSSKWVHEKPNPIPDFAWQEGTSVPPVSPSQEAAMRSYILTQESHHRRTDFKDELMELCRKHGGRLRSQIPLRLTVRRPFGAWGGWCPRSPPFPRRSSNRQDSASSAVLC